MKAPHTCLAVIVLSIAFVLSSCGPSQQLAPTSYLSQNKKYEHVDNSIPELRFYHTGSDSTRVYYKIPSAYYMMSREQRDVNFTGKVSVSLRVFTGEDLNKEKYIFNRELSESRNMLPKGFIDGTFNISLPQGTTYYVYVSVYDASSKVQYAQFQQVEKEGKAGGNYFSVNNASGTMYYDNFVPRYASIILGSEILKGRNLYVTLYTFSDKLPMPSYIQNHENNEIYFRKDTTFAYSLGEPLYVDREGVYFVRQDTLSKEGFSLKVTYDGFPGIASGQNLASMMRYITSDEEYQKMTLADNPKLSVEEFWGELAGSLPLTDKLLRTFMSRGEYANRNFSSYQEGWKSDRGMIYMLYGPPTKYMVTPINERWIYGYEDAGYLIEFRFMRMDNPFSDNDFYLERSTVLKDLWQAAVKTWRAGKVFDNNNMISIQEQNERSTRESRYGLWY